MMKKWIFLLSGCFLSWSGNAQQNISESIEMADAMRASGKIYVVVLVLTVILTGLLLYLIKLDRKVSKLEKEVSLKTDA
jgi:CcmD family protein